MILLSYVQWRTKRLFLISKITDSRLVCDGKTVISSCIVIAAKFLEEHYLHIYFVYHSDSVYDKV